MGKAVQTKTEIQSMLDRLTYLASKRILTHGLWFKEDSDFVFKAMGLKKVTKKDGDGKERNVYEYQKDGMRLLHDLYQQEYLKVAEKLMVFYRAVEKMPTEKHKEICELIYVDGYSLNYVATKERLTVQSIYNYRDEIMDVLKRQGVAWILNCDWRENYKE